MPVLQSGSLFASPSLHGDALVSAAHRRTEQAWGCGRLLGHPDCRAVGAAPLQSHLQPSLMHGVPLQSVLCLCSVNARGVNIWREEAVGGLQWEEMQQRDADVHRAACVHVCVLHTQGPGCTEGCGEGGFVGHKKIL